MDQLSDISVLFYDDALLVVNKPAGLSTLPDGYNPSLPHIKSLLEHQYGRLWIVHRLDKDTSGVLLLARSAAAHRSLNTQFELHSVAKVYHALVIGNPEWQEQTVALPLKVNGDRQHRTVVDSQVGKAACTHLKVLERLGDYCLLEAIPETGRTHQIRAHLSTLGFSILGDKLYSLHKKLEAAPPVYQSHLNAGPIVAMVEGMALHALSLQFEHPLSGERMKFIAPYPESLRLVIEQLRAHALGNR